MVLNLLWRLVITLGYNLSKKKMENFKSDRLQHPFVQGRYIKTTKWGRWHTYFPSRRPIPYIRSDDTEMSNTLSLLYKVLLK